MGRDVRDVVVSALGLRFTVLTYFYHICSTKLVVHGAQLYARAGPLVASAPGYSTKMAEGPSTRHATFEIAVASLVLSTRMLPSSVPSSFGNLHESVDSDLSRSICTVPVASVQQRPSQSLWRTTVAMCHCAVRGTHAKIRGSQAHCKLPSPGLHVSHCVLRTYIIIYNTAPRKPPQLDAARFFS